MDEEIGALLDSFTEPDDATNWIAAQVLKSVEEPLTEHEQNILSAISDVLVFA